MRWNPRKFRTAALWLAVFAAVFAAGAAILLESGVLTPVIVQAVNDELEPSGLVCDAASIYWRPWSGLTLRGVVVSRTPTPAEETDPNAPPPPSPGEQAMLGVDQLEVHYRAWNLIRGRPHLDRLKVVRPNFDALVYQEWREAAPPKPARPSRGASAPPFRIDDLRLLGGRIVAGEEVEVNALRLEGTVIATDSGLDVHIETAGTRLRAPRVNESVEMTGDLALDGNIVRVQGLHVAAAGGRISFEGHVDPTGETESVLQTSGYSVPLNKVGEWIGVEHPLLLSDLEFSLLAAGRPDSVRLSGELTGTAEDGIRREIHLTAMRHTDVLRMETFHLRAGESRVDLQGTFTLEEHPHVAGVAVFHALDPAVILSDPDLAIVEGVDGAVRFEGVGLTRSSFDGTAHLELSSGSVLGFELDRGSARMRLKDGELTLEGATLGRGETEVSGVGSISPENDLVAELSGTIADLADMLTGRLGDSPVSGKAAVDARLLGPLAGPSLDATLRLDNTSLAGLSLDRLDVAVSSARIGSDGEVAIRATASEVGVGKQKIRKATAVGAIRSGVVSIQSLELTSGLRGEMRLAGQLEFGSGGDLAGRVDRLEIRSPDGLSRWENEGVLRVERAAESIRLSGLDLRSGGGAITGRLVFNPGAESEIQAAGTAVDLAVFAPYLLLSKELGGSLDFRADGVFGPEAISGEIALDLRDGVWGNESLERLQGNVTVQDDAALFQDVTLESSFATAFLDGRVALPGGSFARVVADSSSRASLLDRLVFENLHAHLDSPDFDWFWDLLPNVPHVAGKGSFTASIDGPLVKPVAEVRAEVADGRLGDHPITWLSATGSFDGTDLHVSGGLLQSESGTLRFDGRLPFLWNFANPVPSIPSGRDVDLHLLADRIPVGALAPMIPLFEAMDGVADADLHFRGRAGTLHFAGTFEGNELIYRIPTFSNPLVNGHVIGEMDEHGLRITAARVEDGADGVITGTGELRMENLKPSGWDFPIRARSYHYQGEVNGIQGIANGNLRLTAQAIGDGRLVPRFEGTFDVLRAELDERALEPPTETRIGLAMPTGVNAPEEPDEAGPQQEEAAVVPVFAEIRMRGDRDWRVRTPEMDMEMAGEVVLHVTPEYAGLTGEVRSLRGTYSVLNSKFNVERSSVQFTDPRRPLDNIIDAEARARVLDEDVTALVTGTVDSLVIQLSTESGMSEVEIYELLAFRIKRDGEDGRDSGLLNDAFRRSYIAAVANWFGDELVGEIVFLDEFDYEEATSEDAPVVTVGSALGGGFLLRYRQEVGTADETSGALIPVTRGRFETPERALMLEYRLSEIFTLQGEAGPLDVGNYLNMDLKMEFGY